MPKTITNEARRLVHEIWSARDASTLPSAPVASALGYQLEHAELYSTGSDGKRIQHGKVGAHTMHVHDDSIYARRARAADGLDPRAIVALAEQRLTREQSELATLLTRVGGGEARSLMRLTRWQFESSVTAIYRVTAESIRRVREYAAKR